MEHSNIIEFNFASIAIALCYLAVLIIVIVLVFRYFRNIKKRLDSMDERLKEIEKKDL